LPAHGRDARATHGQDAHATAFTLLEVLAATAIMAMVAGSLWATLHVAFQARDAATRALVDVRRCDAAFDLIRADIQSAIVPVPGVNPVLAGPFLGNSGATGIGQFTSTPGLKSLTPTAGGSSSFGTTGDTLAFYATPSDLEPNAGIGDIRYVEFGLESESAGGASKLVRRMTVNLLAPTAVAPTEEVLCRNVLDFTLRYFDGLDWLESWDSNSTGNVLPLAVEVTIGLGRTYPADARDQTPYRVSRVIPVPVGQATGGTFETTGLTTP